MRKPFVLFKRRLWWSFIMSQCSPIHTLTTRFHIPSGYEIFRMSFAFFWAIPRSLQFKYRRFGTMCLFHLDRWVGMKCGWCWEWTAVWYLPSNCSTSSPQNTAILPHTRTCDLHEVTTLHSLLLYSDLPPPCHPPSDWLRLFFKPNLSPYK
jgi:hypothetical protein